MAQGFDDIYSTFGTMTPGKQRSTPASATFAASVAQAVTDGLAAEVDPGDLPVVVTGHSLGGALATLLVADLTAAAGTTIEIQHCLTGPLSLGGADDPRRADVG